MDTPKTPTEHDNETVKDNESSSVTNTTTETVNGSPAMAPHDSQAPTPPSNSVATEQNTPMTLVLQWLTYAFWGWFALAILWLSSVTITYFVAGIGNEDWSMMVAYPVAATIVLLLVAGVVDFFYARVEPVRKQGVATAIMVIHAVIFALCGIGAVIGFVFSLVNLSLNSGNATGAKVAQVTLLVSLVTLFVYAVLLARTLLVAKLSRISRIASGVLAAVAILFIILGFSGPVATAVMTRNDRQLEAALVQVPNLVQTYARQNKKLPASLNDLSSQTNSYINSDTKAVIEKGVIRYTANTKPASDDEVMSIAPQKSSGASVDDYSRRNSDRNVEHYYTLCVTWDNEKRPSDSVPSYESDTSDDYSRTSSISTYRHKKGEQCYDLQAVTYNNN